MYIKTFFFSLDWSKYIKIHACIQAHFWSTSALTATCKSHFLLIHGHHAWNSLHSSRNFKENTCVWTICSYFLHPFEPFFVPSTQIRISLKLSRFIKFFPAPPFSCHYFLPWESLWLEDQGFSCLLTYIPYTYFWKWALVSSADPHSPST